MKNLCSLVLLLGLTGSLAAQGYDQLKIQLQFFNHYGSVAQKSKVATNVIGSEFLYEDWRPMDIQFKDTTVRFDAVKLNLQNSSLEVLYQGEEKMIANVHFMNVKFSDGKREKKLMPGNRFRYEKQQLEGFVEVIGDGDEKVLVQHYIYVKPPNAQAHIVGGHTVNRLMKIENHYIFDGKSLTLIKKRKDLETYYRKKSKVLDQYLKEAKPDLKDPMQLYAVVEKMNTGK